MPFLKQMWVQARHTYGGKCAENRMQCNSSLLSYSPYNCIAILRADVMHISGLPWRDD
jgi:hypothetical protein